MARGLRRGRKALGFRRRLLNDLEALATRSRCSSPTSWRCCRGRAVAGRQRRGDRRRNRPGRSAPPQCRRPVRAGRLGRRPRRLRAAHAARAARWSRELMKVFDHVSVEHVVSGPGLVNIYQFTHDAFGIGPIVHAPQHRAATAVRRRRAVRDPADLPAAISQRRARTALPAVRRSAGIFVDAYGAEAGQPGAALRRDRAASTSAAASRRRSCRRSRPGRSSTPSAPRADGGLVATIPVSVILNPDAGLLGAAVHAAAPRSSPEQRRPSCQHPACRQTGLPHGPIVHICVEAEPAFPTCCSIRVRWAYAWRSRRRPLAQQTGSISGKVADTGGGVLPGVTVEARSDVLPGPRDTVTGAERRVPAAGAAAGQLHRHLHARPACRR